MTATNATEIAVKDNENTRRTTRDDWINLAMNILISEGVGNLKVMYLAQKLNVSRSSFYWFF